ncbi:MAG TPA: rod shape-determining protein MreC [Solirubrobacteraceae bacterium]|nr:rod shape-determining protein MreC [Solirubrobacteraceae bacterium]
MHDKKVRRRRAVLALLVAISLLLLTAYFGESPSSPLHSVQRGIVAVLSPLQSGASTVLSPFKDVGNYFSDLFTAKSRADSLQKQVDRLRAQNASLEQKVINDAQLTKEVGLDQNRSLAAYQRLGADVIGRSASLWYETIQVDKGSGDGVQMNDPVIGDGALVGKVTEVGSGWSEVTLLTDHTFGATAEVQDNAGDTGVLSPQVGNPNQLILSDLPKPGPNQAGPQVGQQVVTAGYKDPTNPELDSLYPPGIPIGVVTNANQDNLLNNGQITVSVDADLRHLSAVQILTNASAGTARAQAP